MRKYMTAVSLGILMAACQSSDAPQDQPPDIQSQVEVVDSTAAARKGAQALVGEFSSRLKSELSDAIQSSGAEGAIAVCAEIAPTIADSHSFDGWSISRVSDKNRNPDNRATLVQQEILQQFTVADSAPPFIDGWTVTDSGDVYQYFQPIRVQPVCLNCHGGIQTLAPGVMTAVRKEYPMDKASGYKIGDLRGMFVVEAHWPTAKQSDRQSLQEPTDTTAAH